MISFAAVWTKWLTCATPWPCWQEIESSLTHRFARAAKAGKQIEDIDLFGATLPSCSRRNER
jgi:hypothetical protein